MLELEQLTQLMAVAEHGTLSAAAEALHISQPSLTRSMQKLENVLGVALFERKKNRVLLNEAGLLAVEEAGKVLSAAEGMETRMAAYARSLRTIAVGSCAPAPMWEVTPLLSRQYPEMTITAEMNEPDKLEETLATVMANIINDVEMEDDYGILRHEEEIDLMSGNIELSGLEVSLVNVMSRELVMRSYIEQVKDRYDYILIDCMPSLGMITINAFACADSILIPVQAAYLPVKGLEQLIKTIGKVKRQINPKLSIEGILLTMVDSRTNNSKEIAALLRETYGNRIKIFDAEIPRSVRAAEISAEGTSIFEHDPGGKVAQAYHSLTKEVLQIEEQRQKHRTGFIR